MPGQCRICLKSRILQDQHDTMRALKKETKWFTLLLMFIASFWFQQFWCSFFPLLFGPQHTMAALVSLLGWAFCFDFIFISNGNHVVIIGMAIYTHRERHTHRERQIAWQQQQQPWAKKWNKIKYSKFYYSKMPNDDVEYTKQWSDGKLGETTE